MIVFNLDGTLANIDHRLHFLQTPWDYCHNCYLMITNAEKHPEQGECSKCNRNPFTWESDYKSFNESCDKDTPIYQTINLYNDLRYSCGLSHIEIWTGRCESIREKTEEWLTDNDIYFDELKMRSIGDNKPEYELKFNWANDEILLNGRKIEFVFDSDIESIEMFRRRGIFVFDCNQRKDG